MFAQLRGRRGDIAVRSIGGIDRWSGTLDRIVLEATPGDGSQLRWSFNDIRPDSMVWRGERSLDGGKTW